MYQYNVNQQTILTTCYSRRLFWPTPLASLNVTPVIQLPQIRVIEQFSFSNRVLSSWEYYCYPVLNVPIVSLLHFI